MTLLEDLPEKKFLRWVKATLGLQVAKRASSDYVKHVMTSFINELKKIHKTDEDHFDILLYKVLFRGEVKQPKTNVWRLYDQTCQDCTRVFDRMLDEFYDRKDCTRWRCHDKTDTFKPDLYWWIVSKIYISGKCKVKHATGPEEVDPFAVFSLMRNCKQFDQQIKRQACCLIGLRHELMHSSNNLFTENEMEDSFAMIKDYINEIKNNKPDLPTNVINDLDKKLEDLDKLQNKRLSIFDKENNLHDCTKKAVHIQQQCLRTDFDIPSDSKFDISTELIQRIERKKCENEKQQLREELTRMKEEKELQAQESTEKLREELTRMKKEKELQAQESTEKVKPLFVMALDVAAKKYEKKSRKVKPLFLMALEIVYKR